MASSSIDLTAVRVAELIPQQAPFVMVDRLLAYSELSTRCALTVSADNLFAEKGTLRAAGLIEHIAQTCAVRLGFYNQYSNTQPQIGYIGAIKDFSIKRLPKVGETVECEIRIEEEVFGVSLVSAQCFINGSEIAQGKLKIALGGGNDNVAK